MTKQTLESARLKLERAEELINEIRSEYDERTAKSRAAPGTDAKTELKQELSLDGPWFVMRCIEVSQPPKRWGESGH
jgi:hypothetical protein